MLPSQVLTKNIDVLIESFNLCLQNVKLLETFDNAVNAIVNCYRNGGRLYIAGNGGSAADAQHLAAEFVSKLARERNSLPAEALTTDSSVLTAIGNDYGFDKVFSRQLSGKVKKDDIFLGISTSGNSPNILDALSMCELKGVPSILFTGKDGGGAAGLATYPIIVPGIATSTIQEQHIILAHSLCECVESEIFNN